MTANNRKPTQSLPLGGVACRLLEPFKQWMFKSGTVVGVAALNAGYQQLLGDAEELAFFESKILRIHLRDWGQTFDFIYQKGQIRRVLDGVPDVTFSGYSVDFINLARQEVDPDTLFFQRRLTAQGDMALAVELKNCLAGFDVADWPVAVTRCLSLLADLLDAMAYAKSH